MVGVVRISGMYVSGSCACGMRRIDAIDVLRVQSLTIVSTCARISKATGRLTGSVSTEDSVGKGLRACFLYVRVLTTFGVQPCM